MHVNVSTNLDPIRLPQLIPLLPIKLEIQLDRDIYRMVASLILSSPAKSLAQIYQLAMNIG